MADITKAKAGDTLSDRAVATLRQRNFFVTEEARTVQPKAPGNKGQWLCIDCGHPCANQVDAHNHAEQHGRKRSRSTGVRKNGRMTFETITEQHRLAWRNFETGDIEEP